MPDQYMCPSPELLDPYVLVAGLVTHKGAVPDEEIDLWRELLGPDVRILELSGLSFFLPCRCGCKRNRIMVSECATCTGELVDDQGLELVISCCPHIQALDLHNSVCYPPVSVHGVFPLVCLRPRGSWGRVRSREDLSPFLLSVILLSRRGCLIGVSCSH